MKNLVNKLHNLRMMVLESDVPHPTTPEYRELHEKMQRILKMVDEIIDEAEKQAN